MCYHYLMNYKISNQWVAGFFDGEGSVSVIRRQRGNFIEHFLSVQLGQQDRTPLDLIHAKFGGSTCDSMTKSGCHRWRIHGKEAELFLKAIRKYSIVKRRQIDLALKIRKLIGKPGHRLNPQIWAKREKLWIELQKVKGKL